MRVPDHILLTIAEWSQCTESDPDKIMEFAAKKSRNTGDRCWAELTPQLVGMEGARVEVTDLNGCKRRFWVGRSTGWLPCHLEVARIDSSGGPAVSGGPFQSVRIIRWR